MVTINLILEDIMQLAYASREMLLEILQKRQIEARRSEIARTAKKTLREYHSDNILPLSVGEVIEKLKSLYLLNS
jgi:hypothetical protein